MWPTSSASRPTGLEATSRRSSPMPCERGLVDQQHADDPAHGPAGLSGCRLRAACSPGRWHRPIRCGSAPSPSTSAGAGSGCAPTAPTWSSRSPSCSAAGSRGGGRRAGGLRSERRPSRWSRPAPDPRAAVGQEHLAEVALARPAVPPARTPRSARSSPRRRPSTVGLSGFAAIVRGDGAALVPVSLAERSTDVELAVAAAGAGIAEAAAIRLDLVQQEVVVAPGLVADNTLLVDDIVVAPGRYQLRSVFWPEGQVGDDERPVSAVARMAESVALGDVDDRRSALEQIVAMRDRFDPRPVPRWGSDLSAVLGTLDVSDAASPAPLRSVCSRPAPGPRPLAAIRARSSSSPAATPSSWSSSRTAAPPATSPRTVRSAVPLAPLQQRLGPPPGHVHRTRRLLRPARTVGEDGGDAGARRAVRPALPRGGDRGAARSSTSTCSCASASASSAARSSTSRGTASGRSTTTTSA